MQKTKRPKYYIAVFLLLISLLASMLPASALSFTAVVADGKFGENNNLTWTLDNNGLLTVSGKDTIKDVYVQDYPWYAYAAQITAVKIKDGVQNIGEYMFEEYDALETVEIGEGVLIIGKYSFNYCDNLRSVHIPQSLRRIDEQAFFSCPLLTDVHITDASLWCGIEFMSAHANPLYNGADLLLDGRILTAITPADFLTAIGNFQFYGCQSLVKINLHEKITAIRQNAFGNCPSLRVIYCAYGEDQVHKIFDQNTDLDKELFVWGDNKDTPVDDNVKEKDGVLYNADMTMLLGVTDAVKTELIVPDSVTQLASGAFSNCFALQSVALPAHITKLPDSLFENCRNLQKVTFSDSLIAIGENCFKGCLRLSAIKLPDTLQDIGAYAFSGCRALQEISLTTNITYLNDGVFADCVRLTKISLPEKLQTIGSKVFFNCYNLQHIDIPTYVQQIGTAAFMDCHALQEMILPDGITELPEQLFYQCYNLTTIRLPVALKGIGSHAFYDCVLLASVQLPDTLIKIGEYAFHGCEAMAEIVIPQGVEILEDSVFKACLLLSKVTLPDDLQEIRSEAFRYCQSLTSLYIPSKITLLSASAFDQCYYLKKLYFSGSKEQWIKVYPDGIPADKEVIFEHTHTTGKWQVVAFPGPEQEGLAQRNCDLCHATQTEKMQKTAFAGNENATVTMDGYVCAVAQYTIADLLLQAGEGACVTAEQDTTPADDTFVGTGMQLQLADGTQYTLLVIGDTNGDGLIDASDARFTLRLSVGLEEASTNGVLYRACDVDNHTGVNASDARSILRASVGLDNTHDWLR